MDLAWNMALHSGARSGLGSRHGGGHLLRWLVLTIALALIGGPGVSSAHDDPPTAPVLSPSSLELPYGNLWLPSSDALPLALPEAPWLFMLGGLMAMSLTQRRQPWRRATALVLTLSLGGFTFGVAVHAVHHLDDPRQGAECLVFSVSQHTTGTLAEAPELGVFSPGPEALPSAVGDASLPSLFRRTDQPRAPPLVLA